MADFVRFVVLGRCQMILDAVNPLTPFWLAVTTFFETGLGVAVALFYLKVIPYFHRKSESYFLLPEKEIETTHNPISLFLPLPFWPANLYPSRKFSFGPIAKVTLHPKRPMHPLSWITYVQFLRTGSFLILFTSTALVLTSTGWRNPFLPVSWNGINAPGWFFDLVYARVNNQPNGAHCISELMVMVVGWTAAFKYRDKFGPDCMAGLLAGGFLLAFHEGPWEAFYYLGYSQYLSWALITNVLKDISFASMVVLFFYSYWKYPLQRIHVRKYAYLMLIWFGFLVVWFFVPSLYGYGIMPISTINNFQYGHGIFSETQWWGNPVVEGIFEIGSWVMLGVGISLIIAKSKLSPLMALKSPP